MEYSILSEERKKERKNPHVNQHHNIPGCGTTGLEKLPVGKLIEMETDKLRFKNLKTKDNGYELQRGVIFPHHGERIRRAGFGTETTAYCRPG